MLHRDNMHVSRAWLARRAAILPMRRARIAVCLGVLCLPLFSSKACALAGSAIAPDRLRVDSLDHPVGLDDKAPEFSWVLKAVDPKAHGLTQSAYRIMVASTAELLLAVKPDMWDSGRVASMDFLHVAYGGRGLASHSNYFWRVCLWDQDAVVSEWSAVKSWTTGLLFPSDWSAKWIAAQPERPSVPAVAGDDMRFSGRAAPLPIFRREFAILKPLRQAVVFVSGLGQYELTVNGRAVTGSVLNPGWTDYRKTVLYQAYDVTPLLRHGSNCLGILLGNGMYDVPGLKGRYTKFVGSFGEPKLILQMQLSFADGSDAAIVSDKSWTTSPGPILFSSIYGGEDFDARKDPPEWKLPGFRDSTWTQAVEVAAPSNPLTEREASLLGTIIPAMKVIERLAPIRISKPLPGILVYDFGRNFSGWPEILVKGAVGAKVRLTPAELLDAHGLASQESADARPGDAVQFNYMLKGGGRAEAWRPRFSYYGFRYVQVDLETAAAGGKDAPEVLSVEGDVVHDDVPVTGGFVSGLPVFNRIHNLIDRAILNNLASVLTDCPTREKLGWLEQTHLMGASIMANFDVRGLYRKMADDMADSQLASGLVPSIAPEFIPFLNRDGGNTAFRDSPEWGSAVILSPWIAYRSYGDRSLLAEHYGAMTKYAAYLRNKSMKSASGDSILDYGLGDWYDIGPNPPGESQLTGKGLTATAIYYQDLIALAEIARILNKDADADAYSNQASRLKDAFNRRFFHSETNQYDQGSQTANAMPLALGMVPEDRRPAVLANLVADIRNHGNHVTAGDVGFHYVVRALTGGHRSDVLFDMLVKLDSPSYGYQLSKGATALTEAWDANPNSSQDHFMLGHAEEWFYRGLAGIQLDLSRPPGEQIIVQPALLRQAKGVRASVDSVLGMIRVSWTYADSWALDLEIPAGESATVVLPGSLRDIAVSPKPMDMDSNHEIHSAKEADGNSVFVIGSGVYRFISSRM